MVRHRGLHLARDSDASVFVFELTALLLCRGKTQIRVIAWGLYLARDSDAKDFAFVLTATILCRGKIQTRAMRVCTWRGILMRGTPLGADRPTDVYSHTIRFAHCGRVERYLARDSRARDSACV